MTPFEFQTMESEETHSDTGAQRAAGEIKKVEVVVVEVNDNESEGLCRVCHLSREVRGLGVEELIWIGCGCRGELAVAHRDCGEAWFRVKGNRYCEICHMYAKNIVGEGDSGFMEEWHEGRLPDDGNNRSLNGGRVSCWRGRTFCNCMLACLIIALVFVWFFHIKRL